MLLTLLYMPRILIFSPFIQRPQWYLHGLRKHSSICTSRRRQLAAQYFIAYDHLTCFACDCDWCCLLAIVNGLHSSSHRHPVHPEKEQPSACTHQPQVLHPRVRSGCHGARAYPSAARSCWWWILCHCHIWVTTALSLLRALNYWALKNTATDIRRINWFGREEVFPCRQCYLTKELWQTLTYARKAREP